MLSKVYLQLKQGFSFQYTFENEKIPIVLQFFCKIKQLKKLYYFKFIEAKRKRIHQTKYVFYSYEIN